MFELHFLFETRLPQIRANASISGAAVLAHERVARRVRRVLPLQRFACTGDNET